MLEVDPSEQRRPRPCPPAALGLLVAVCGLMSGACGGDPEGPGASGGPAGPRGPVPPDRLVGLPPAGRGLVSTLPAPAATAPAPPEGPLGAPWTMSTVGPAGGPSLDPTVTENGPVFSVSAAGHGLEIAGLEDEFLFVHRLLRGDGAVVAVVRSFEGCDSGRVSFGPMIRAGTDPGSAYVMAAVSGREGVALQSRATSDIYASTMRIDTGTALPLWLKVERRENQIRAGHSPDGQRWVEAMNVVHDFGQDVEVGIAASSHRGVACRALFESVEVLGTR